MIVTSFSMLICQMCFLFGKVSVLIFCPHFDQLVFIFLLLNFLSYFVYWMYLCVFSVMSDSFWPHSSGLTIAYLVPLSTEILPARILDWVAISSSRGSSWSRDWIHISCIGWWILYTSAIWEPFIGKQSLIRCLL